MRHKRLAGLAVLIAILALWGLLAARHLTDRSGEPLHVFMGSTQSTSGVYTFGVAVAAAINKYDPGLVVTVVETSGAYDNARRMKDGIFHWSVSGSPAVYAEVRQGSGYFQRYGAWEPIRLMFIRGLTIARLYVRADWARSQHITTWADLTGKRVAPGMPGTRDMSRLLDIDRILGTGVEFVPGSLGDSVTSLKEGRVVALLKGSPPDTFDASMLECHYGTPLTVIGFAAGDAQRVRAVDLLQTFTETLRGTIKNAPEVGDCLELSSAAMALSSSMMSQQVGYRITKAVYAGWKEIGDAFAPALTVDPIKDAFANTPDGEGFYYHAGVVQFARERGIDVPARFVPPEYRDVR